MPPSSFLALPSALATSSSQPVPTSATYCAPRTDIGYWIDGEYEGRGITSRAARALISSVFDELGLTRMELRTSVDNKRSRALAERLGFSFEGVLPGGLRFSHRADDVAMYGVTAAHWNAPLPSVTPRRR